MRIPSSATTAVLLVLCQLYAVIAINYDQALKKLSRNGVLHLTDKNYKQYIKNENFSLVVFYTAEDPRVQCTLCHDFGPKFKGMATQYYNSVLKGGDDKTDAKNDNERVIFAFSDFSDSRDYFQRLGLTAVPRLFFYEPGKGPSLTSFSNEFSFVTVENTDGFTRWVTQNVPGLQLKDLHFEPPIAKSSILTFVFVLTAILFTGFKFQTQILSFVQTRKIWEFSTFCLIILFISGHMYNQIRGPDMYKTDKQTGQIQYFAQGHNSQYGAETQIIAIIYGVLSITLGALIKFIPNLKDPKTRLLSSIVACLASLFMYTYLVTGYTIKSPSYPFHLITSMFSK